MDKYRGIHTNQRLLLQELEFRGAEVDVLVPEIELAEVRFQGVSELILDRDSGVVPYAGSLIAADKYISKRLLIRAGIQVPDGEQFFIDQLADLVEFSKTLKPPFVIKPSKGSHGTGCFMNLISQDDIEVAVNQLVSEIGVENPFMIEEQISGSEIRVLINRNRDYVALRREAPWITGDGASTIKDLIERENHERSKIKDRFLCPILIDVELGNSLRRRGVDYEHILPVGEKLVLRGNSNITSGGVSFDVTDSVSAALVEVAGQALEAIPRLPYAGVDLIVRIVEGKEEIFALEINSNPGIKMHHLPAFGPPRDAASIIADMIFPGSKRREIAS